jgi:hypothetical protein
MNRVPPRKTYVAAECTANRFGYLVDAIKRYWTRVNQVSPHVNCVSVLIIQVNTLYVDLPSLVSG